MSISYNGITVNVLDCKNIISKFKLQSHNYVHFWTNTIESIAQSATASLQRGKTLPNEHPGYDTKQSDGEVPIILEVWGMWSTPLLPSVPRSLWSSVVAPDQVLAMGLIELFDI